MNLAIKGHETRGAEVIEILKMLGGTNPFNYSADSDGLCFYIGKGINDTNVIYYDWIRYCYDDEEWIVFTLEEFLEKFPYKVGDKVIIKVNNQEAIIDKAVWCCDTIIYWLKYDDCLEGNWRTEHLRPYKEETMKEKIQTINLECGEFADKVGVMMGNYEVEIKDGITFFIKKQPQYPKTYEECCEVLMGKTDFQDFGLVLTKFSTTLYEEDSISPEPPHITLINNFYKLLICRDAYWKIAGEEMGLSKPWEPDWNNGDQERYGIIKLDDNGYQYAESTSFVFPTEEMRDTFFENFKELIEICKELL